MSDFYLVQRLRAKTYDNPNGIGFDRHSGPLAAGLTTPSETPGATQ